MKYKSTRQHEYYFSIILVKIIETLRYCFSQRNIAELYTLISSGIKHIKGARS